MKNFIIITNRTKDKELQVTNRIRDYLTAHGAECIVEEELPEEGSGYTEAGCVPENTECAIVLGGDGTMLQAAIDLIRRFRLSELTLGLLGFFRRSTGMIWKHLLTSCFQITLKSNSG